MSESRIAERKGFKLELDLRTAVRVESFKIGSPVKVLVKSYGNAVSVYPGIVIGFEPFPSLPTIFIAYVTSSCTGAEIKTVSFNTSTENIDVVAAVDGVNEIDTQQHYSEAFDRAIRQKREELRDLEEKKQYFLSKFDCCWSNLYAAKDSEGV